MQYHKNNNIEDSRWLVFASHSLANHSHALYFQYDIPADMIYAEVKKPGHPSEVIFVENDLYESQDPGSQANWGLVQHVVF